MRLRMKRMGMGPTIESTVSHRRGLDSEVVGLVGRELRLRKGAVEEDIERASTTLLGRWVWVLNVEQEVTAGAGSVMMKG